MYMYLFLYIIVSIVSIFLWYKVYLSTRNLSGKFFLNFTVFLSIWFIFYFLFFVGFIVSPDILLYLSRINFIIWIITVYSLWFFIFYFDQKKPNTRYLKSIILPITLILIYLYIFSWYIIESIRFVPTQWIWREVYGELYWMTILLYIIFLVWFVWISIVRLRTTTNLERVRLTKILYWAYFMLFMLIVLQVFLPLYDIWILEKELIFFYLYFVVVTYFAVQRYYFWPIGYGLNRAIVFLLALSLGILWYMATLIIENDTLHIGQFWFFDDPIRYLPIVVGITVFYWSHRWLSLWLNSDEQSLVIQHQLSDLQNQVIGTISYDMMKEQISAKLVDILGIRKADIHIFDSSTTAKYKHLIAYFQHVWDDPIYMHDIVFQEIRRSQFDMEGVIRDVPAGIFLIFPILHDSVPIGLLMLSSKRFGDFFTKTEITLLSHFARFLSGHTRYIQTYTELQELSHTLDQKVDEKTIDYNNLINRQKEFITMISHEIKSPISSAIFQSDSIIDDIDEADIDVVSLRDELKILNQQLVRTGSLISKLFSVQYYDTHQVTLFLERVSFAQFIEYEISLFAHIHRDIRVISEIDGDIGFVDLDRIQFQQVLSNLLENALKFVDIQNNPIIAISASKSKNILTLKVEDNGSGFSGIDLENLFDKYTTGSSTTRGLGMWLYLCKTIIAMHHGTIEADSSPEYGGARFIVALPIR